MNQPSKVTEKPIIGWREWISLPQIGVPGIKVKIDTGARSSALHTHDYKIFERDGQEFVRFHLHPLRRRNSIELTCEAPVHDYREVKDSGGHPELRPFIRTLAKLGEETWEIDINLTNREAMKFRMLLGREALAPFLVNPSQNYLIGKNRSHEYRK
jgi:hypothetical protein